MHVVQDKFAIRDTINQLPLQVYLFW